MIHTPIFFWLSLAALAVASYFHIRSSQNFQWYGQTEINPLWKDKYGFFTPVKYVVSLVIFVAVVSVIHFTVIDAGYQTGIVFYIMAGAFVVMTLKNNAAAKKNRAKQIEILTRLRSLSTDENVLGGDATVAAVLRPAQPIVTKGGRSWFRLFGWLWIDSKGLANPIPQTMIDEIQTKIVEWSRRPEKDWFLQ
jgi:hypothetical protein